MEKKIVSLLIFVLLINPSWSIAHPHTKQSQYREIECSIKPIDRSKIHPTEGASTSGQVNSSNWSGYASAPSLVNPAVGSVTYVSGNWTVPQLVATSDATYCAIWVGIDGFLDPTVEQIGTSHNWIDGAQQNYVWFEMYPNGAYEIEGFPLNIGDKMAAVVNYAGNDVFHLTISNHTQGVGFAVPISYTTAANTERSSAEWIVEAPFSGGILPLSNFQATNFTGCFAIINGFSGAINNDRWQNDEITMVDGSVVKSEPTPLMVNGTSFEVIWNHQ